MAEDGGVEFGYPRPEDVVRFLEVYDRATTLDYKERTTYQRLIGEQSEENRYTTILGQLRRIAEFAVEILPADVKQPLPRHRRRKVGAGVEVLFARLCDGDGGLQPTPVAKALSSAFRVLREVNDDLKRRVSYLLGESRRQVRGGAGPNFSHQVCPYIFSQWKEVFGQFIDLSWTTHNTAELLPRLNAGVLDFVISYGGRNETGVREPHMQVAFSSFGYDSKFVLGCHPKHSLWMKDNRDLNAGYWEYLEDKRANASKKKDKGKAEEKIPRYSDLWPVSLEDVHWGKERLLVTRSWWQPEAVRDLLAASQTTALPIQLVDSFDEALAMVRLQLGIAIFPEVFSKRPMFNAFRLEPHEAFTGWIGTYYSTRFPLSFEAYTVLSFIKEYLTKFKMSLRNGRPASFPDAEFDKWCRAFGADKDWRDKTRVDFPM